MSETQPKQATRASSQMALEVINPIMTETMGGSADLTGSNNTLTADLGWFDDDNRKGRHVAYGIREHGMAAAMNGMVLHGGARAYGGTFFTFTDYARPSMRLASLMKIPTVFVMTHDSIGVGEDGPTHAGAYDLSYLRCIPNMVVMAPSDEAECRAMLQTGYAHQGPAAVRYPRGTGRGAVISPNLETLEIGQSRTLREGQSGIVICGFGRPTYDALVAADALDATLIDMRFVKPLDQDIINTFL